MARGRQYGSGTSDQKEGGRERQRDLDESLTGISELSSIPAAGNLGQADSQSQTFDSEASTPVAPPLQPPRPPVQVSVNESTGERSGGDQRGQQTQPSAQLHHPLHTTHRTPVQQRLPLGGEGSEGREGGTETESDGEGDGRRKAGVRKVSPTKIQLASSRM